VWKTQNRLTEQKRAGGDTSHLLWLS
jgi:hypothetical protein